MPLYKVNELHTSQHLLKKTSCNMTRYHSDINWFNLLISDGYMKKVVVKHNYFIKESEKKFYIKIFHFSQALQPLKYCSICEGKIKCSKLHDLSSLLEDEFHICSSLHSAVSRKSSTGLWVTHVENTVVLYDLALVNPLVSSLAKKSVHCSVCWGTLVS